MAGIMRFEEIQSWQVARELTNPRQRRVSDDISEYRA